MNGSYFFSIVNFREISAKKNRSPTILSKINANLAKTFQNLQHFWSLVKYMGTILGQNLVNGFVNFHFPSAQHLPAKNILEYHSPGGKEQRVRREGSHDLILT